jgi:hypothetical protein
MQLLNSRQASRSTQQKTCARNKFCKHFEDTLQRNTDTKTDPSKMTESRPSKLGVERVPPTTRRRAQIATKHNKGPARAPTSARSEIRPRRPRTPQDDQGHPRKAIDAPMRQDAPGRPGRPKTPQDAPRHPRRPGRPWTPQEAPGCPRTPQGAPGRPKPQDGTELPMRFWTKPGLNPSESAILNQTGLKPKRGCDSRPNRA